MKTTTTPLLAIVVALVANGISFKPATGALNETEKPNFRKPAGEAELRFWLQNMVWHHRFTDAEVSAATGMAPSEVSAALKKLDITPLNKPRRPAEGPLLVLPYPGGRHPRIGFLDGAVRPQR